MKHLDLKSKLTQLYKERNTYLCLSAGLILALIVALFAITMLIGRERTILVPPVISNPFWVTHDAVSASYLEQMSQYFIGLRLNVSPASVQENHMALLKFIAPEDYGPIKSALAGEEQALKDKQLSSVFYIVNMDIDESTLTVNVTGDLTEFVGSTALSPQRVTYQIQYEYKNARLLVQSFTQVENPKND